MRKQGFREVFGYYGQRHNIDKEHRSFADAIRNIAFSLVISALTENGGNKGNKQYFLMFFL